MDRDYFEDLSVIKDSNLEKIRRSSADDLVKLIKEILEGDMEFFEAYYCWNICKYANNKKCTKEDDNEKCPHDRSDLIKLWLEN